PSCLSSAENLPSIEGRQMVEGSNGERDANPKVEAGCADEVGERGAFRMVNRISQAAMSAR
ncbi:MAG TPA: hypothetical protein VNX17_12625, partial [Edaphobacter sp.]|nr:hypothetical protein [Edaphobacter sp.]